MESVSMSQNSLISKRALIRFLDNFQVEILVIQHSHFGLWFVLLKIISCSLEARLDMFKCPKVIYCYEKERIKPVYANQNRNEEVVL